MANGTTMNILGKTRIKISIGSESFEEFFRVAKELAFDVVIGADIIRSKKMILDFDEQKLKFMI